MSVEAPERIWVERDPDTGEKRWFSIKGMGDTEYVRADKLEELAAALRIAQGNTDAAIEDYNEAQAALAEAKRENEALREALKETRGNLKAGSTKAAVIKQIDTAIARNAGGNDA